MNTVIKKETIKRLIDDIKSIKKSPLTENGVYYSHCENDMLKGYAMIIGQRDTPYAHGAYFFEFDFPKDYPYSPPKVTFLTKYGNIRFNPNLYRDGKVCVSILNTWEGESWNSCETISTILLHLMTLLCSNPMANEPYISKHNIENKLYNEVIEYANIDVAVIRMISRECFPEKYIPLFYETYYEYFANNREEISDFVISKINAPKMITITFYEMKVLVDYLDLKRRLDSI